MCYSAQVWEDYRKYMRTHNADISIREFVRLYKSRKEGAKVKIPKGMDATFMNPKTDEEREIYEMIQEFDSKRTTQLEKDIFKLKTRLANAERKLLEEETESALKEKRIATNKIKQTRRWLEDLRRTEPELEDSRIYPKSYAPVMIWEQGKRVIKPMRYQCRPQGVDASFDIKFSKCYNARRDKLGKFWRRQFGYTHGVIAASAFYEHVEKEINGEKKDTILEFKPQDGQQMWVACLWSHWQVKGEEDLWSFAAITDEPPPEVKAAGHDRCIIPIKQENIDAWLNPDPANLAAQYAILDDRMRPYYEHRMAA